MRETQEMWIHWRRAWQSTPVFLPVKSLGQRSLVGYSPWGCKESGMTEWLSNNIQQKKSATISQQCLLSSTACQLSGNGFSTLSFHHLITTIPLTQVSKISPALYLPVHFWGILLTQIKRQQNRAHFLWWKNLSQTWKVWKEKLCFFLIFQKMVPPNPKSWQCKGPAFILSLIKTLSVDYEDLLLWVMRSSQSILKKINLEYLLEGLMLKLKVQYFGHLIWKTYSLEKTLMLGKIQGRRRRGQQRIRWLDSISDSMDMSLSKLWEMRTAVHGVTKNWTRLSNWKTNKVVKIMSSHFGI